jgi:hypothetical protein
MVFPPKANMILLAFGPAESKHDFDPKDKKDRNRIIPETDYPMTGIESWV